MNISLRRAAALQNSIRETIKSIPLITTVSLNEFQDSEPVIQHQHAQLEQALAQRHALNLSLYEIRRSVSDANKTAGIDSMLTELARIEQHIEDLSVLCQAKERMSATVIEGRLAKIRNDTTGRTSIYGEATVETSVLSAEELTEYRHAVQNLRRERQALKDRILEFNVRTEIVLSDVTAKLLHGHNLI